MLTKSKGFTLVELMIVVTIIGILATIAVPSYKWSLIKAREAVLRENLYSIRSSIDQFYADQGKYPDTLQDLVDKKYIHGLPTDPFTRKTDSWETIAPPAPTGGADAGKQETGNVYDVHSGSDLVGTDGKPYKEW
ncbi:type II secretion system protein G [Geobacter metallireducens RCH3]|nr:MULTISPECIES: prepilin-type N-terminal cleavage/methylation domain-containing protein [Geobacter]EHP88727.1 type II secretion system protein G [Geobacter metallireducens RCH3]MBT1074503.1 prepilin-type N-terminal cleavage/methylation domain-containing protein [Geobacter grbiciae]